MKQSLIDTSFFSFFKGDNYQDKQYNNACQRRIKRWIGRYMFGYKIVGERDGKGERKNERERETEREKEKRCNGHAKMR